MINDDNLFIIDEVSSSASKFLWQESHAFDVFNAVVRSAQGSSSPESLGGNGAGLGLLDIPISDSSFA